LIKHLVDFNGITFMKACLELLLFFHRSMHLGEIIRKRDECLHDG